MNHDEPVRIAQELLARLGSSASPEEVALLFSPGAVWEIPGDVGAFPWLGRQQGRAAAANFVRDFGGPARAAALRGAGHSRRRRQSRDPGRAGVAGEGHRQDHRDRLRGGADRLRRADHPPAHVRGQLRRRRGRTVTPYIAREYFLYFTYIINLLSPNLGVIRTYPEMAWRTARAPGATKLAAEKRNYPPSTERGPMRRSRKLAALLLGMAGAAVVGSLLAGAPAALATTTLEPREGRKECRSVPNCVTVKTPAQDLRAGKLVTREFSCPKGTYFWNWSATVAQFVQVSLQETRLDKKSTRWPQPSNITPRPATVRVRRRSISAARRHRSPPAS